MVRTVVNLGTKLADCLDSLKVGQLGNKLVAYLVDRSVEYLAAQLAALMV